MKSRDRGDFNAGGAALENGRARSAADDADAWRRARHLERVIQSRGGASSGSRAQNILDLLCEKIRHLAADEHCRVQPGRYFGGIALVREFKWLDSACSTGAIGVKDITEMIDVRVVDQKHMDAILQPRIVRTSDHAAGF